jgi:hypothetical protein
MNVIQRLADDLYQARGEVHFVVESIARPQAADMTDKTDR